MFLTQRVGTLATGLPYARAESLAAQHPLYSCDSVPPAKRGRKWTWAVNVALESVAVPTSALHPVGQRERALLARKLDQIESAGGFDEYPELPR